MTIIERIREIIRNESISVETFSKETGISRYTLDSMFKKGTNPSFENLTKIISAFTRYSLEWLITGKGEMIDPISPEDRIKNKEAIQSEKPFFESKSGVSYYEMPNGKYKMRVPLIPIKAYAKYIDEYRDCEFINNLEEVEFVVDKIGLGKYFAFEIKGDSMDDDSKRSISDKDIVLARELRQDLWYNKLHNDEYPYWIIVLDNTIVCKQITEHNVETGEIICHSLNPSPEYADFRVSLNDVRQLCNIVARQSSSF
ncbi:helix-turn-helix transcriptional regulator [Dysgonomonas sp. 216]|nr:helix-turn-helix transcriptional regulator [Dysgonomonas sp. 216]